MGSRYSVALEQQNDLYRWVTGWQGQQYIRQFTTMYETVTMGLKRPPEVQRAAARSFEATIVNVTGAGEPFYWSSQMCELLEVAAATLPEWRLEQEVVPYPVGYMWFDRALTMTVAPFVIDPNVGFDVSQKELDRINKDPEPLCALGWTTIVKDGKTKIRLLTIVRDNATGRYGGIPTTVSEWGVGETITDVWMNEIAGVVEAGGDEAYVFSEGPHGEKWEKRYVEVLKYFAAAMLLMNQHVFVTRREESDKLARKRVTRNRQINVLYLRRALSRQERGASQSEIDWQYQWMVSGHWRWLQCELCKLMHRSCTHSKNSMVRRPVWIGAYTKGDPDKPFRDPLAVVKAMVR